jgi:hypothetical protein
VVLPIIETVIVLPVWLVLALSASKAAFKVAYVAFAPVEPATVTFCAELADTERVSARRQRKILFIRVVRLEGFTALARIHWSGERPAENTI